MKLSEHVNTIRDLITNAFVNQFARLGVTAEKQRDTSGLDEAGLSLRSGLDAIIANHIEETGSYKGAFDKALDEYTFTLFNRLAALKVMESHRMFPEVVTKRAENGGRSFGHRAWLEQNPAMASEELEGLHQYIRFAFDSLGKEIRLYSQESTYDMLPYVLDLNVIIAAVNAVEEDGDVGAEIWKSDDIMGWLYESYTKDTLAVFKDSKAKIEFDHVSLTSQWYTPDWVVAFLVNNSLGKLYLEMYPDSEIKRKYKIANIPTTRVRPPIPLHKIRLIDPATGSANFLLYAFDFFYALYIDQIENYGEEYEEDDIPKLIIENNLYGVDLDDRAIQIAQLGLYIKALRKNSRVHIEKFNVVSSDFYLPDFEVVADSFSDSLANDLNQKQLIKEVWSDLQRAYQFGSLIRLEERFNTKFASIYEKMKAVQLNMFAAADYENLEKFKAQFFLDLHNAVSAYSQSSGNAFLQSKTNDAIIFLEILTQRYDVAVTNPPYTDSGDFGGELKTFVETNYKKPLNCSTNLYATFAKRCTELINDGGKVAMVHPPTFMYIKTFEDLRTHILNAFHIDLFVDWGYLGMFNPKARVDSAMYVLEKKTSEKRNSVFIKLNDIYEGKRKDVFFEAYDDLINDKINSLIFTLDQSKLKIIKSWPFIYWISDEFRVKFAESLIEKTADIRAGIQTSNNNRFLRFWWEVDKVNILPELKESEVVEKWVRYSKGGPYQKWYGNIWIVIDWENSGKKLQSFLISMGQDLHAQEYYFKEGLTYSASGSKGISLRYLPKNHLFDIGGSSVFLTKTFQNLYYLMGLLNSKLVFYITDCLNPTVNKQPGDLKRIPFVKPNKSYEKTVTNLSNRCYEIKRHLCVFSLPEIDYIRSPILIHKQGDIKSNTKTYFDYENHLLTQALINEAIINEKVFEVYELTPEDKDMVLAKEGESIGGLPVLVEARSAFLAESVATAQFPLDNVREFIESLPILTLSDQEICDLRQKFETLYQSNNDLEEFCIRNHINPINVWHLFQKSEVLPSQRAKTIAMEFLADLTREILNEDEDGIVPLVRNAGEEILLDRIEKKFEEKGLSSAQFSAFPTILGKEINEYINNNFFADFSDALNLFMYLPKTPFIWHITSGPRQGFDAYIIIYKWNRDRLFTLKSVYIEKRETSLRNRQSDLLNEKTAQAENEKDQIFHQLKEIDSLKKKIDELLAEGYDPKLDDGVGKNIAPLQKKGIIAYDVLNAGQLKKYLNADW
ncbi:MAG: BREX-1 system adenine-specific DNA-methyltransferase PglX [Desulfuromonadaceae bacterium]